VKVVFLEDVTGTARIGEIKDVKPGFARNYLLPRRLAAPATASVVKSAEQRAKRETRLQEGRDNEARGVAEKLEGMAFEIRARAGASGKLFGSVGTSDIAEKVAGALNAEFDRHNVMLADPIKDLGDYPVTVKLTKNVSATVNVSVIGEDGTTAADIRAKADAAAGESAKAQATQDAEDQAAEDEARLDGDDEDEE
jgi:large subunit ribosomal protein L9